jgi:hypothetical protein
MIFPREKIIYQTNMIYSLSEICKEFVCTPEEETHLVSKQFCGRYDDLSFKIWHIPNRKNSFNPIIKGKYDSNNNLVIKQELHLFVRIFLIVCYISIFIGMIGVTVSDFFDLKKKVFAYILLFLFLLIIYFLPRIGFNADKGKRDKYLEYIANKLPKPL